MAKEFGDLLRHLRKSADVTMGQLARYLGVATPYLSDVERGKRSPISNSRIRQASDFLGLGPADYERLIEAAAESRGFFELAASNESPVKQSFGAALARQWTAQDDARIERMRRELNEEDGWCTERGISPPKRMAVALELLEHRNQASLLRPERRQPAFRPAKKTDGDKRQSPEYQTRALHARQRREPEDRHGLSGKNLLLIRDENRIAAKKLDSECFATEKRIQASENADPSAVAP